MTDRRTLCWSAHAPTLRYACTLPLDHKGDHEDHLTAPPVIYAWPRRRVMHGRPGPARRPKLITQPMDAHLARYPVTAGIAGDDGTGYPVYYVED